MPLHFSDEEINLLLTLSEPIDRKQRHEFLRAVANELASCELAACEQPRGAGSGSGWCIASREVQRRYSLAPLPGTGKHARPQEFSDSAVRSSATSVLRRRRRN